MSLGRPRDLDEVARQTCRVLMRKARLRKVLGEEIDECITIVKRYLNGGATLHETATELSSLLNLRYTEVERVLDRARRDVER